MRSTRPLTVLSVAYSLASVRPETAGGAEQVLRLIDSALVKRGHSSIVMAGDDSEVAGQLLPVDTPAGSFDEAAIRTARERRRAAIQQALHTYPVDVVHMHGQDFDEYLPDGAVKAVVTLHCPREWYNANFWRSPRPRTWFHCVSKAQRKLWPDMPGMLPEIPNGVPSEALAPETEKAEFVVSLGRISPEKGTHHALDAATRAGVPLIVAGQVFPFPEHERYFAKEVRPRLGRCARFAGPVAAERKRRLLARARCLLLPSLAHETSSLVAMEALAAGTPVIAFPSGAVPDIVEDGVTGFLVNDTQEMAEAIGRADEISPEACRETARRRFSADATVDAYIRMYERIRNLDA